MSPFHTILGSSTEIWGQTVHDGLRKAAFCLGLLAVASCDESEPERFDIAYVEQNPTPPHLRYMSDSGNLSSPVYLPNDLSVQTSAHNSLSWSPDGDFIALSAGPPDDLNIYTMRPGGGDFQQITTDPSRDESPDWSPDGTHIVFISNRNDPNLRDIYIHDLTARTETRITPSSSYFLSPVWSADNTKIAYAESISFTEGDEIFIYDVAAGTANPIGTIPGPLRVQGLHWSPSPDTLVFYAPGGFQDVYRIRTDGTGLSNLTNDLNTEISTQPSWFDGNQVLFVRSMFSASNSIYRMSPTGAGKTLIGDTDSFPWGPVYRFEATDLPDLVVSGYSGEFDVSDSTNPTFELTFTIRNIGMAPSPATLVYVDAVDPDPPTGINEIRVQQSADLPGLDSGEVSAPLTASFQLAELFAKDVSLVRVTADPKNNIIEAFESNNVAASNWP